MTNYPGSIDTNTSIPPLDGYQAPFGNPTVEDLRQAIFAIETELGIIPAGAYATVRTRLDILEARVNNPLAPSPDVMNPFMIGSDGVTIRAMVGNPQTLGILAVPGSLFLREDAISGQNLYSYGTDGNWSIIAGGGGGGFIANGDLSGTSTNQIVVGIEGKTLPSLTTGYLNYTGSAWQFSTLPTSLPPSGPAGGDLDGTYPNPIINQITGNVTGQVPISYPIAVDTAAGTVATTGAIRLPLSTSIAFGPGNVKGLGVDGAGDLGISDDGSAASVSIDCTGQLALGANAAQTIFIGAQTAILLNPGQGLANSHVDILDPTQTRIVASAGTLRFNNLPSIVANNDAGTGN